MRSSFFFHHKHVFFIFFFFSSRRRHTRFKCDWSSDVCSSDLETWKSKEFSDPVAKRDSARETLVLYRKRASRQGCGGRRVLWGAVDKTVTRVKRIKSFMTPRCSMTRGV